jgi:hypothetical protein
MCYLQFREKEIGVKFVDGVTFLTRFRILAAMYVWLTEP